MERVGCLLRGQHRAQWQAFVNMVMEVEVPYNFWKLIKYGLLKNEPALLS
jgi:hypothetical protein